MKFRYALIYGRVNLTFWDTREKKIVSREELMLLDYIILPKHPHPSFLDYLMKHLALHRWREIKDFYIVFREEDYPLKEWQVIERGEELLKNYRGVLND